MSGYPNCPECGSDYTYEDGEIYICPECGHERSKMVETETDEGAPQVTDAHGNLLADGDSVTVIKDIKVKGSSSVVKVGTKVKNNILVEDDHNIDCRINDIGAMMLKSEFVQRA